MVCSSKPYAQRNVACHICGCGFAQLHKLETETGLVHRASSGNKLVRCKRAHAVPSRAERVLGVNPATAPGNIDRECLVHRMQRICKV